MTSSRKSRRSRALTRPIVRRALVGAAALGAFAFALYAFFVLSPVRLDPAASRASVDQAVEQLRAGNASAARQSAIAAVRTDPASADAHLVLARSQLQLGEGIAAEAEIKRANEDGIDPGLTYHLRAQALLLQGEPERAIAEADKTDPRFRSYGLRIRARAETALGNYAKARDTLEDAVRISPNDVDAWTDTGRFRFTVGDIAGAIAASQRAVELSADNLDALVLRGQLVRTQYGLIAALPWFERALARDPYHHDALIEYAATLGDAGRTVEMLAATRKALQARPGSPQAFYLQAVLAARAGNTDLARRLTQKTGGAIDSLPGMLLLGSTLDLQAGDSQQALNKLRLLVGNQPMNITARKLLAIALLRSDAARNALDMLRPVALRGDADTYSLTLVARGFERIGERDNAARFLDRAAFPARAGADFFSADDSIAVLAAPAQERPNDPAAVVPLIRALIGRGDTGGALARAQAMVRDNPGVPGAYLLLGDVLMLSGRNGDAATTYKQAADLRFDEATMLRLVESLEASGRRAEAANVLALFLSQNPFNFTGLRMSAHWLLASGDYDNAVIALEGLRARIGDRDAALNADLAIAYAGAGNAERAKEFGEAAYVLTPGNPAAADAWGWALFQAGDDEGALELLQKAVAIAPRHSGIRWHLAQVYAEMKRPAEAKQHAQAALADPRFTDRAAAQAILARAS
jgi:tetratricopeptide (TPR) repeat protein